MEEALEILFSIKSHYYAQIILYKIAKTLYSINSSKAYEIINNLPTKYQYGFRAFLSYNDNDTSAILQILNEIETLYKNSFLSDHDYDYSLLMIADVVVNSNPYLADQILKKIETTYMESYDLQSEIVVALSKDNLDKALEYLSTITPEFLHSSILVDVIKNIDVQDTVTLLKLYNLINIFPIDISKYKLLYAINQKVPISFEEFMNTSTKLMPYEKYLD